MGDIDLSEIPLRSLCYSLPWLYMCRETSKTYPLHTIDLLRGFDILIY
jgi:hypothetical protein